MYYEEKRVDTSYDGVVETAVEKFELNHVIAADELYKATLHQIPQQTYYKTLENLVRKGELVYLAKGLYYRPKKTRFGIVPISEEEISKHYLRSGEGILVGYHMFNRKGITTQIGKRVEILSNTIPERKKEIKTVSVRKISAKLNEETIPVIEVLEILQNYYKIEDMNTKALIALLETFSQHYSDEAAQHVLTHIKYKKSTIAFLASILNHMEVPNTLERYLSSISEYKTPNMEALYESAQ